VKPLRSWTVPGDPPLTITIHQPAMTLRHGDGPEVALNPEQIRVLNGKFADAESFFDYNDPEVLD
jgi:hypothetical protein